MTESEEIQMIYDRLNEKMHAAENLNWGELEEALQKITVDKDKGLRGVICYFAAYYMISNGRQEECLSYLNESIECMLGTSWETELPRCYNMIGVVAHGQNNLILAMENYEKGLSYAREFGQKLNYGIILSNMADGYSRIGAYDKAVEYYRESIEIMRHGEIENIIDNMLYHKILANFGFCCIIMKNMDAAERIAEELRALLGEDEESASTRLAINTFYAMLAHKQNDAELDQRYTEQAINAMMRGCTISADFDNILNLINFLIHAGRYDKLEKILDYLEPLADEEENDEFLLQVLQFRMTYCSGYLDEDTFLNKSQLFFRLKDVCEKKENNQLLRMMNLSNQLKKIEEQREKLWEKNTKLLYQTRHDELSGLYNKRYLNMHMEEMFDEALQKEVPLGVLFVDIDYFKQMNDRYGHQKGDECIILIADAIRKCLPGEFAARYGGDEFVILTVGKAQEQVAKAANQLVDTVAAAQVPNADALHTGVVTVTVGGVCAVPCRPNKIWDFLTAADETLYRQKEERKGRALFYELNEGRL